MIKDSFEEVVLLLRGFSGLEMLLGRSVAFSGQEANYELASIGGRKPSINKSIAASACKLQLAQTWVCNHAH